MCKFNQNLFLVTICGFALIELLTASPVDLSFLDDLMDGSSSYDIDPNLAHHDLKYDQRQNGTENLRLNLDGVIVAFPASTSNQAANAAANVAANYLLQLAAASEEDEDSDYFPFLKNANQNGIAAPNDKETVAAQAAKDDKNSKKKASPPGAPAKEPEKIVVVKEYIQNAEEIADPAVAQQSVSAAEQQQQAKIEVIPVKKVQSRRKNKHKFRLAGLMDFLERYRDQI